MAAGFCFLKGLTLYKEVLKKFFLNHVSLLGLIFLPSAFEIDQGLEKFQNP